MTRKGVWNLQQVRDKYLQSLWEYKVELFAWGSNDDGALGQNSTTQYSSPVQVIGSGANWSSLWLSNNTWRSSCSGVKDDGTLWMWGYGYSGSGGNSQSQIYRSSPTQIPGNTWIHVSSGGDHTVAPKSDGTLWVWGDNGFGQLAQNDIVDKSSPVQVGGDTTWRITNKFQCVGGEQATYGIKTDGTLWSWGKNESGQLGLNNTTHISSPVQVGSETTWSLISGNKRVVGAIKTDGTLWTWGLNKWDGQLGHNDKTERSSPTQIPGTSWSTVFAGDKNMCATRTDGTLFVWGQNDRGGLGINFAPSKRRSSPTQIPGTNWSRGVMGENFSMWRRTDGTLWGAGLNSQGQQGNSDITWRSSPIQIGSDTDWEDEIAISQEALFGLKSGPLTPSQL